MDLIENLRFPRFFINGGDIKINDIVIIGGADAKHICTVLRMKAGGKAVLCNEDGFDYPSEIVSAAGSRVEFKVLLKRANDCEPKMYLRLFQCVPKGEKLDFIVQKATELGASEIIPVISKRCVSRPDNKNSKILRLQKIAEQAAKQSGRGKIPIVGEFTGFNAALKLYRSGNLGIIFYENGGMRINDTVKNAVKRRPDTNYGSLSADIFVGSEGGFEPAEIAAATEAGLIPANLGRLILRAETAPIAAISILMNLMGEI
ncbi:MAG: 16S rRNA (uracil(1498)-N(3))-methyltransferase [Oscillospiraceae bacterium]|nr:16S rRNA (uracil(1498)-N(3))-methyltransferase [Oscillospiraceae bacterium]